MPTLLLIGQDEGSRMALQVMFRHTYRVITATDGAAAIRLVRTQVIHTVVLEVDSQTLDTLGRLKSIDPGLEAVGFYITLTPETARLVAKLGVRNHFEKPFEVGPVRAAVDEATKRRRNGARPLNEAKLMLVGRGGAGKTSIAKRLLHDTFDPHEKDTLGVDVQQWETELPNRDWVRIHVWDFGGQDILHGTHQLFFTDQTIYLLVLNGRDASQGSATKDAEYWLQLIRSYAGGSQVIVALNKFDLQRFEVNRELLLEKHPTIVDFVPTDCKTKRGLDSLHSLILQHVEALEHRRLDVPLDWFGVKEWIADSGINFLSWDDFQEVCLRFGVSAAKAQRQLAKSLHVLGIALNYSDDLRLKETSVLNPRWVTDGIYTILQSTKVSERGGVLKCDELEEILDKKYPKTTHTFLLSLMERFQLCFPLPGDPKRVLIPQLLSESQPDIKVLLEQDGLDFRYQYQILPEGLLPRFIVQTHLYSQSHPGWRWRTGVVLEYQDCLAVVRADMNERRVDIHVTGRKVRRRDLLAIIREKFEEQYQQLKALVVDERIPIPGEPGITASYADLLSRLEVDSMEEYRPEGAKRPVRIRELLNMFESQQSRQQREEKTQISQTIHHHHYSSQAREFPGIQMKKETIQTNITNSTLTDSPVVGKAADFAWTKTIEQMPDSNLKAELERLAQVVASFLHAAKPENAERANDNFEILAKQATKPKLDSKWFQMSKEGLLDALSSVAGTVDKALPIIEKIRTYLGL